MLSAHIWFRTLWVHVVSFSPVSCCTTWTVRPAPEDVDGQLPYIFNSIEPTTSFNAILQPVLQCGISPASEHHGDLWAQRSNIVHLPMWLLDNLSKREALGIYGASGSTDLPHERTAMRSIPQPKMVSVLRSAGRPAVIYIRCSYCYERSSK
ncbi:hypothetical protein CVT25_014647 [Psilocybe cyanescens]|uniref:Uncharacterized protein n=1 Tax=Psilocybe cyanescens TaxID=93625 RepID=A0A409WU47_PSICY|nr:hypothetical protein CVT25_014647 [Psilocybe cyanescens]